ncbi:MAG TPA: glycoside hydrolase family 48 protein [Micromonosporaceae bacterium]|nr:glycoside hydrolase family 48 protein [Micromonosporaceae bacterium]
MRFHRFRLRGGPRRTVAVATAAALGLAGLIAVATPARAAAGCQVTYSTNDWAPGFTGSLAITNLGDPLTSWSLSFTFPTANQRVGQGWNARYTQTGSAVTVANETWNGALGTNQTVTPGFNGTFSGGSNPKPTDFALNGVPCVGANRPPTVSISSPSPNAQFTAPASVQINATASDPDAGQTISRVEFYHDGLLLGEDTTAPYSYTWAGVPAQATPYRVQARAYDSLGAASTVADVPITVSVSQTPHVVFAGDSLMVTEGGTATIGVRLSSAPTANTTVTVARAAGDADLTVTGGATLTFTPTNWNTAQTVTVAAATDADRENGTATLRATATGYDPATLAVSESDGQVEGGVYVQRFLEQYAKLHSAGYFSPEGVPYHSIETLIVEAPDHGHETTSEAFSFWIWLEAQYGRVKQDWGPFNRAWETMERYIIPSHSEQTTGGYNPANPATYAPEHLTPDRYPSVLDAGVRPGTDPLYNELTSTYGNTDVYGMHWLLDVDNTYGFGKCGDGTTRPAYINTFQRGPQESVWETVPHPSCETLRYGAGAQGGYASLFVAGTAAAQWRYTNAPDADARAVQAAYWANIWATQQGKQADVAATVAKAAKMGDYLRYAMYDKYFKRPGCTTPSCPAGTGKDSATYLMSWYYAWGGSNQGDWAWRIGSSHNHQGYQNPFAAYVLGSVPAFTPRSPTARADWQTSLGRQMEFYQWLQSSEGAIAGGATNSWNGNYSTPPAGTPTFYGMAYDEKPVYHDPASNTWFGFQAWSVERVAEYYYVTGDARAKAVLDKWVTWALANTTFGAGVGDYRFPNTLAWSGAPATWNAASPRPNTGLHVTVQSTTDDVGIGAAYARLLTYYGAKANHAGAKTAAKRLLDGIWSHSGPKGASVPETRTDYSRFDDVVPIPAGYSGTMPNGDPIRPGSTFLSMRSFYENDPDFAKVEAYLNGGPAPTFTYHRFWAQSDIAMAMADYGLLIGD